jgi:hypothetical protein
VSGTPNFFSILSHVYLLILMRPLQAEWMAVLLHKAFSEFVIELYKGQLVSYVSNQLKLWLNMHGLALSCSEPRRCSETGLHSYKDKRITFGPRFHLKLSV